jgi:CRP-like cAMP-binding protein
VALIRKDAKVTALRRSPLFEGLSGKQLGHLARLAEDLEVPTGTVLCKEGQRGREFFVIIEGEAAVTRGGRRIATVRAGEFFGEIALLVSVNRTATVTALTPVRFFVISDGAFKSMLDTDRAIERTVLLTLARRVLSNTGDPTPAS